MTKFFKKSKNPIWGSILGLSCPNLGKNEFSRKIGQFLNIKLSTTVQKIRKNNDPFLRKMANWCSDRQTGRQAGRWQTDRETDKGDFIGPSIGWGSKKKEDVSLSILHHNFLNFLLHLVMTTEIWKNQVADKVFEWLIFIIKGVQELRKWELLYNIKRMLIKSNSYDQRFGWK